MVLYMRSEGSIVMSKRGWVIIIMTSLIVNVISLQHAIEAYYGREYDAVTTCMVVSIVSVIAALVAYFNWRKLEYNK
ncbi:hypothetical protein D3C84_951770 [compost metagenome]